MRILRGALIGVITIATAAVLPPLQAVASPPSPPYNAYVVDGGSGSYLLSGILAFDATNSTISASSYGSTGFVASVSSGPGRWWDILFAPPTGSTIVVGTTYPTLRTGPDATHGFMSVGGDGRGCNYQSGFMTVTELTLAPGTNNPTSLAASVSVSCENDVQVFFAEVRVNSSIGYAATDPGPNSLAYGDQPVGSAGTEKVLTFTAKGSSPSVFGAASIVDGNMFTITNDTCSNTTLAGGDTCTIGVTANATALGQQNAKLKVVANTGSGAVYIGLYLNGIEARRLSASPTFLNLGSAGVGETTAAQSVTITANGTLPVTLGTMAIGGTTPSAFGITGDTCSGVTLQVGQSCSIAVVGHPTAKGTQSGALNVPANNAGSPGPIFLQVMGQSPNQGTYYPLTPSRILDTRIGNGAPTAPVGPGGTIHLQVAGRGGVPASGVSAVVLNVTLTGPTTSGHITVFPTGVAMPTASSLNFSPGWTGANSVTIALGTGGQVDLFNSAGNTHLIADVVGYYAKDNGLVSSHGYGGELQPVLPERLFDSRIDWGQKLPAGYWVNVPVSYGSTYDPHIRALAVNITAVDAAGDGYLTSFNGYGPPPLASTLNVTRGSVVPNFAVVPTGWCYNCGPTPVPMIGVYTSVDVHVIVDIVGFYDDGQLADGIHDGLRFAAQTPLRITDSRIGQGMPGALNAGATASIAPPAGSLPPATEALALNVTAVSPTSITFISVWPNGLDRPTVSTLNPNKGQIVPNATDVLLGAGNMFNIYNNAGSVHIVIDMVGTFYFLPALSASGPSLAIKKADGMVGGTSRGYADQLQGTRQRAQLHHL